MSYVNYELEHQSSAEAQKGVCAQQLTFSINGPNRNTKNKKKGQKRKVCPFNRFQIIGTNEWSTYQKHSL